MKDQYEVTIGIPVFRALNYIKDTMDSALKQTFSDIEYLVVDDYGNDGTIEYISFLKNNNHRGKDIRILKNDKNHGVSFCRNRIIDEAKGKYLFFMDADDLIEPYTIQYLYSTLIHNQTQISYGSYEIVDKVSNGPTKVYQKKSIVLEGEDTLATYAFKHNNIFHVSICNCLINIDFLRKTKLRFMNVSFWEDMAFTTELVTKINRAVLLSDITYHYIRHEDSLSHYCCREQLNKDEIMQNISVLQTLKSKTKDLSTKPYVDYLCYNLEMTSFYIVCHILKNYNRIIPMISFIELRDILRHPLSIIDILGFKHMKLYNLVFWLLAYLPIILFIPAIQLIGRYKKAV